MKKSTLILNLFQSFGILFTRHIEWRPIRFHGAHRAANNIIKKKDDCFTAHLQMLAFMSKYQINEYTYNSIFAFYKDTYTDTFEYINTVIVGRSVC